MKPNYTKIFFGVIIFLFSVSLAYFAADYIEGIGRGAQWTSQMGMGLTMFCFGIVYAALGVFLYRILPVSLGLLLAADVALIDALARNYDKIEGIFRVGIIGGVLIVVYLFALYRCKDHMAGLASQRAPQTPQPPTPGV